MNPAAPSLRELQEFLAWLITEPRGPEALLSEHAGQVAAKLGGRDWTAVVAPRPGSGPARRLEVYGAGFPTRIFEALSEMYPSVKRVTGDAALFSLAGRYIAQYPSKDYSLSAVGRHLPEFLRSDPLTERLPFLPDLAILDRAAMEAFHAPIQEPVSPGTLSSIDPSKFGECRIRFQAGTCLLASHWPVATIRELREAPDSEFIVKVEDNPERMIVWRSGYEAAVRKTDMAEFAALEKLLAGGTIWEALEAAAAIQGDDPPAGEWFRTWMSGGLAAGIVMP